MFMTRRNGMIHHTICFFMLPQIKALGKRKRLDSSLAVLQKSKNRHITWADPTKRLTKQRKNCCGNELLPSC